MIPENPYEDRFERTFAFIDLSGFTHFTDVMGDKAALEEINTFRAIVREIASRKGIRISWPFGINQYLEHPPVEGTI